jgi:hypothetical protein
MHGHYTYIECIPPSSHFTRSPLFTFPLCTHGGVPLAGVLWQSMAPWPSWVSIKVPTPKLGCPLSWLSYNNVCNNCTTVCRIMYLWHFVTALVCSVCESLCILHPLEGHDVLSISSSKCRRHCQDVAQFLSNAAPFQIDPKNCKRSSLISRASEQHQIS